MVDGVLSHFFLLFPCLFGPQLVLRHVGRFSQCLWREQPSITGALHSVCHDRGVKIPRVFSNPVPLSTDKESDQLSNLHVLSERGRDGAGFDWQTVEAVARSDAVPK